MAAVTSRVTNFLGNGSDLIPLPLHPVYREITWGATDTQSANISPYTKTQQTLVWPGADYLSCSLTLPELTKAQANYWLAALQQLRGGLHAFQVGDPFYTGPQHPERLAHQTGNANILMTDSTLTPNTAGSNFLGLNGLPANVPNVLTPGDYIQVGYRLHRVLSSPTSNSVGQTSVEVYPSLRQTYNTNTIVDIAYPVGIFRRADNSLSWTQDTNGTTTLSFKAVEFR